VKYLNHILPVGKVVHRYKPYYSPQCPSCSEPIETQWHMVCCPADDRALWRTETINAVRQRCQLSDTSNVLSHILRFALDRVLSDSGVPIEDLVSQHDESYRALLEDQALIGWEQLLLGRFSKLWIPTQDAYVEAREDVRPNKINHGESWLRGIVKVIFKQMHVLWLLRNSARHGRDAEEQSLRRLDYLRARTEYLYSRRHLCRPCDAEAAFYPSLVEHFHRTNTVQGMENWISMYEGLVEASIEAQSALSLDLPLDGGVGGVL